MSIRILWPRTGRDNSVEEAAVGAGIVTEFARGFGEVTDEQWRNCDGIVGVAPPESSIPAASSTSAAFVVKTAVGFDDVDIEAFGNARHPGLQRARTTGPARSPTTPSH